MFSFVQMYLINTFLTRYYSQAAFICRNKSKILSFKVKNEKIHCRQDKNLFYFFKFNFLMFSFVQMYVKNTFLTGYYPQAAFSCRNKSKILSFKVNNEKIQCQNLKIYKIC